MYDSKNKARLQCTVTTHLIVPNGSDTHQHSHIYIYKTILRMVACARTVNTRLFLFSCERPGYEATAIVVSTNHFSTWFILCSLPSSHQHTHVHTHIHAHTHACMCTHMCTHAHTQMHTHTHTHAHTHTCTCMHIHAHTQTHTRTCTHTHTPY